jgi:HCOMODA/2-hydroxy-3-carboxy-muconic semialdehyde decarboxylase
MTDSKQTLPQAVRDLVIANRILGHEGVVDAFGHVSMRHPERPDRYLLSRSRSPGVVTEDDILQFDLDSNPVDADGPLSYAERFIHGCVYKARPDVNSVCHSHAHALVPFTVTGTPMRPLWAMSAAIGDAVPIWDIRDDFPDRDTLLVVDDATGASLARTLGHGSACMMRGHGATIATASLKATVLVSVGLMYNADMLFRAELLTLARGGGQVTYLSEREIRSTTEVLFGPRGIDRAWEYWSLRAGFRPEPEPRRAVGFLARE